MAYSDDRPARIYVVRAPVLKVEISGARLFFAAVGEVSSRMELLRSAHDHLPLLDKNEIEVAAVKSARLYDLLGSRLPSRVELHFAWFGVEVKGREPPSRCVHVRFKITLRDGAWRRRRTISVESTMEAFTAEALVWFDLARREARAHFNSAKLGRLVPRMVSHLDPFHNFDTLKRVMPLEPPARFKVRKARAPRGGGDTDLRSFLT